VLLAPAPAERSRAIRSDHRRAPGMSTQSIPTMPTHTPIRLTRTTITVRFRPYVVPYGYRSYGFGYGWRDRDHERHERWEHRDERRGHERGFRR